MLYNPMTRPASITKLGKFDVCRVFLLSSRSAACISSEAEAQILFNTSRSSCFGRCCAYHSHLNIQDTMSAHAQSGDFPRFDDGDVVISLTARSEDALVLHSQILAFHSEYFRTGLDANWLSQKITGTKMIRGRGQHDPLRARMGTPCFQTAGRMWFTGWEGKQMPFAYSMDCSADRQPRTQSPTTMKG